MSKIRTKKVHEVRKALADGTYETRRKVDITVKRLLERLRRE